MDKRLLALTSKEVEKILAKWDSVNQDKKVVIFNSWVLPKERKEELQ